ncbi:hypothetical protein DVH24_019329 [Malus domestica]|uniref:Uncharacterized protein n=1 Tax=Malus domestica TaxID=3750 RepID=A0A498I4Q4_MALDO|nr:hypothetical protein DVH24_019329 [Malus domestica]
MGVPVCLEVENLNGLQAASPLRPSLAGDANKALSSTPSLDTLKFESGRAIWQNQDDWERWCKISTVKSHRDRLRATRSGGAGRHGCERRAGAGLGQVVRSRRNWTTRSLMLGYW